MTEQERRALFFKVTGQVYALTSMGIYNAFCKGLEAGYEAGRKDENEAATELRRLHEVNAELVEALGTVIRGVPNTWDGVKQAKAVLAKAQGEKND